jgi:hypothetical protein|tara:strand:+ start:37255 stop:37536 length:282 start_codon:yes stop_codon:yes gene_type:complete
MAKIFKKKLFSKGFINIKFFLISLAVGLLYVYVMGAPKKVIVVYPTPDSHDAQYVDAADNCYMFNAEEVKCPTNKSKIKKIPIQKKSDLKDKL